MRKSISGKRYNFLVKCYKKTGLFCFYIKAISVKERRYSHINNLNCILSNLDIDKDKDKIAESQWSVGAKEARRYFKKANIFLSDKIFLNYLEKQLDLDRHEGEWENIGNI